MNMELLQKEIDESGMPISTISERSGIPRSTIYYRIEHPETWKVMEMVAICRVMKFTKTKRSVIFDLR